MELTVSAADPGEILRLRERRRPLSDRLLPLCAVLTGMAMLYGVGLNFMLL